MNRMLVLAAALFAVAVFTPAANAADLPQDVASCVDDGPVLTDDTSADETTDDPGADDTADDPATDNPGADDTADDPATDDPGDEVIDDTAGPDCVATPPVQAQPVAAAAMPAAQKPVAGRRHKAKPTRHHAKHRAGRTTRATHRRSSRSPHARRRAPRPRRAV